MIRAEFRMETTRGKNQRRGSRKALGEKRGKKGNFQRSCLGESNYVAEGCAGTKDGRDAEMTRQFGKNGSR